MRFNKVMNMKKKGVTMIELIAVMAMIAIIGLGIMSLYISQTKLFNTVNNETIIQDEARLILTSIEDDLRFGRNTVFSNSGNSVTINSNNYTIPALDSQAGTIVYGFTKSEKDASGAIIHQPWAYILYGKTLVKAKGVGTDMIIGATPSKNVNSIAIAEEISVVVPPEKPSVKYNITMKLEKGSESDTFESLVIKR